MPGLGVRLWCQGRGDQRWSGQGDQDGRRLGEMDAEGACAGRGQSVVAAAEPCGVRPREGCGEGRSELQATWGGELTREKRKGAARRAGFREGPGVRQRICPRRWAGQVHVLPSPPSRCLALDW